MKKTLRDLLLEFEEVDCALTDELAQTDAATYEKLAARKHAIWGIFEKMGLSVDQVERTGHYALVVIRCYSCDEPIPVGAQDLAFCSKHLTMFDTK